MSALSRRTFLTLAAVATLPPSAFAFPLGRRPGIQLYTVGDALRADTPGTLAALHAIGYREVETAGFGTLSPRDFRNALDAAGLTCVSCHLPLGSRDDGPHFEAARILGARTVVTGGIGTVTDAKSLADIIARANRIGAAAAKAGLQYAYHNHNHEFRLVDGAPAYDRLLRETDAASVKFQIDCGWMRMAGHDPARTLRASPGRFVSLHIKDFVKEDRPSTDLRGHRGAVVGRGFIDYRPIFAAASGVGHFFVEQEPSFTGTTALEAAQQNFLYLQTLR